MATELGKAYVQIVPSAKNIKGSMASALSGEASSAGSSAGLGFGSSMLGGIKSQLAGALGSIIKDSLGEGAELQQSLGGIETLFKESADTVKGYAAEAYKTAGVSANDYMSLVTSYSASLLQSLGGDTQKSAEVAHMAMVDMSDNANKMGTDMEAIQNAYNGFAKGNYTMLDNLKLGYGGTQAEMKRLLADAKAITGVEYDISNLADVYSAIHVIQTELDITGTTAKEASTTLSGSMASMKAAFSNVLGQLSLGQDIGPALSGLFDSVKTFLMGNLLPMVGNIMKGLVTALPQVFSEAIKLFSISEGDLEGLIQSGIEMVTKLAGGITASVPKLLQAGSTLLGSLKKSLFAIDWKSIAKGIISDLTKNLGQSSAKMLGSDDSIISSLVDSVLDAAPDVIQCGGELLSMLVQGISDTLPLLAGSALDLINQLALGILENAPAILSIGTDLLNQIVTGIFSALPSLAQSALNIVTTLGLGLVQLAPQILESGKEILLNLLSGLKSALPGITSAAGEAIVTLGTGLLNKAPDILAAGFDLIASLIKGIGEALPDIITAAGELVGEIWDAIKEIDWLQLGKDIIQGMIDGIGLMGDAIWEAAKKIAKKAWRSIKNFFGISSPSRLMRDSVGKMLPAGMAIGIEANTSMVTDAMESLAASTAGVPVAATVQMGLSYGATAPAAASSITSNGGLRIEVKIENFNNNREQDVDALVEELSNKLYYQLKRKEMALA